MTEMQSTWALAQEHLMLAAQHAEQARVALLERAHAVGSEDWILAREVRELVTVVADGAWSARRAVVRAREALLQDAAERAASQAAATRAVRGL